MTEHSAANCYGEPDVVMVSSMDAMNAAVASAPPGRQILITPGDYAGGKLTFDRKGAPGKPIVIRPASGALGTVTIKAPKWTITDSSAWLVFSRLYLNGGQIILRGDHNRLTRIKTINFGNAHFRVETARDCRIDHCDFTVPDPSATRANCINYRSGGEYGKGRAARLLIDHNWFHDLGKDCIAIDGFGDTSVPRLGHDVARGQSLIVERNLFQNIGWRGEFVVLKIGGMVWRGNTFLNINGYFQQRVGAHGEFRSNWFEGGPNMSPSKAFGKDLLWIGNRFQTGDLWVPAGNATADDVMSNEARVDSYARAEASTYIGNSMVTGRIIVGTYHTNGKPTIAALKTVLEGNVKHDGSPAHTLTSSFGGLDPSQVATSVKDTPSMAFEPAVKLTPDDVGLKAPDPFCA